MQENYDDIINLPHHVSESHPQMSLHDRAAQFSPFAALTGYDAQVSESGRLTENKIEVDDYRAERIDVCLQILTDNAAEHPEVTITYFRNDEKKSGGAYTSVTGSFRRIDESDRTVVLTDGTKIPIADIYSIEGSIFRLFDEMD